MTVDAISLLIGLLENSNTLSPTPKAYLWYIDVNPAFDIAVCRLILGFTCILSVLQHVEQVLFRSSDFQAMLDFAADVYTARSPQCESCPIEEHSQKEI